MVEEYKDLERVMREKKLAPSLPYVKALFLGWFEPLREAIAREQKVQQTKKHKAAFAPHIDLLPPDKMALIVMYNIMGLVMVGNQDGCVQVVQAAVHIGMAIEQEVRIHSLLEKTKNFQRKKTVVADEDSLSKEKEILRKHVNVLIKRKRLREVQNLLVKEEIKPWVVIHSLRQKLVKNYVVIECDSLVLTGLDKTAKLMLIPYVPMLVPPRKWKGYDKGGHLFLPSYVMRAHGSRKQVDAMGNISGKKMMKVFEVPVPDKPPLEGLTEVPEWKWSVRKAKKINQERHSQRCDTELKLSDGSCNGLQHYAALGRDSLEAAAVNLVAGEKPANVYSEIAVSLAALGETFQAACGIMAWLSDCAKVIASENQPVRWTTPLGLPVVQPYCKNERHLIRTSLQVLALQRESNSIDGRKQRTACPPKFVHSLDSSHMMMTALACRDAGLCFAGVHDSFWTHACDVDQMNEILRKKIVELYSMPILENLLESFQVSYPALTFPPLRERGDFDLQEVLQSPYFLN
ncbi:hypothetical protein C1H46_025941 [Malus baccata]|uniref:DNA-directed RNA polymerase n=1 Tax=Malus baccata TaxID=106549 RepID=A0A540LPU8_MALBA|nr:hypothetical protein C1H46_025941 [Malus baccata]